MVRSTSISPDQLVPSQPLIFPFSRLITSTLKPSFSKASFGENNSLFSNPFVAKIAILFSIILFSFFGLYKDKIRLEDSVLRTL